MLVAWNEATGAAPVNDIEARFRMRLGDFMLDAAFTAPGRGITALFGQSGSGETSVVNMIAGLVRPERGRIAVDGRTLFDSATKTDVPPHRRRIGSPRRRTT